MKSFMLVVGLAAVVMGALMGVNMVEPIVIKKGSIK